MADTFEAVAVEMVSGFDYHPRRGEPVVRVPGHGPLTGALMSKGRQCGAFASVCAHLDDDVVEKIARRVVELLRAEAAP